MGHTPSLLLVRESTKMFFAKLIIAIMICLTAMAAPVDKESDNGKGIEGISGGFVETFVEHRDQKDGNELKGGQNNFLPFGGRPIGNQKDGNELKGGQNNFLPFGGRPIGNQKDGNELKGGAKYVIGNRFGGRPIGGARREIPRVSQDY